MSGQLQNGEQQFFDNNGKPLNGGTIDFYVPNTTTRKTTWQDQELTIQNTNPIILDSGGKAIIWGSGSYRQVLKDNHGNLIWDQVVADPIVSLSGPTGASQVGADDGAGGSIFATVQGFINVLALSIGSSLVGFIQAGVGAVLRTMQSKARDILHVRDFGVVGDGVTDDYTNVMKAITAAYALGRKITLDFNGCTVGTSQPLVLPAGGHVSFKNGKVLALASFSPSRYLIEANNQSAGLVHHDLSFDLELDAAHTGGCLLIDNYIRIHIAGTCRFLHFSTDGLRLDKTIDSHECSVADGVSAFEYLYGEPGYLTPTPTSVGFRINSFDNSIGAVVSYYTGSGMIVNAQYNQITKAHLGGVLWALRITENAAYSSFSQCYIDSASVEWKNPWHSEMIGCKFLWNTADPAACSIIFKPLAVGLGAQGIKIMGCSFHNIGVPTIGSMFTDTSAGSFDPGNVRDCHIVDNSFVKSQKISTRPRLKFYQNAATSWPFDFGPYVPFGVVQWASAQYYEATSVFPTSQITSIVDNVVTVSNSAASNGTVFIEADINIYPLP